MFNASNLQPDTLNWSRFSHFSYPSSKVKCNSSTTILPQRTWFSFICLSTSLFLYPTFSYSLLFSFLFDVLWLLRCSGYWRFINTRFYWSKVAWIPFPLHSNESEILRFNPAMTLYLCLWFILRTGLFKEDSPGIVKDLTISSGLKSAENELSSWFNFS